MRVYELARELGLESKDVLARAVELGVEVKTASSGLDDDSAALVRLSYEEETAAEEAEEDAAEAAADAVLEEFTEEDIEAEEAEVEVAEKASRKVSKAPAAEDEAPVLRPLTVQAGITVFEFAGAARRPMGLVVKALIERGQMAGATQPIPIEYLEAVGEDLGYRVVVEEAAPEPEEEEAPKVRVKRVFDDDPADLEPRPPVVTVMGHVDHGKTRLLDFIRSSNVVEGEAGGITQHIGAYQVERGDNKITFIDTPGHEAFTTLRARGAEITDIVILMVAADDGVMPQTVEAISHAKAAGVPIVVAINKIDLESADPYAVRAQLTEHELIVEELGGDVVDAEISALEGTGIEQLLEYIDLIAELEEFSANPKASASGTVIEAQLEKGRGPVATVIVQRGTLRTGDALVAGQVAGRVRAMFDENGQQVKEALPSTPVVVMGWDAVPQAGDDFDVVKDDRVARSLAAERLEEIRRKELVVPTAVERLQALLEDMRTAEHARGCARVDRGDP